MFTFNELITFEHEIEHVSEHNLLIKKNFSTPKIYNANGDLSKRWYVYFSFRNPETGKLQRMKNIYGKVNLYKTKEDRLLVLSSFRKRLIILLKQGYNPFEDNNDLYLSYKVEAKPVELPAPPLKVEVKIDTPKVVEAPKLSIKDAFEFALKIKKQLVKDKTLYDYQLKVKALHTFLADKHPTITTVDQLNKKIIQEFLNGVLIRSSSRNRNNHRLDLSSLMQTLEDNDMMPHNIIKNIPVLKSIPERNKTYTKKDQEAIFKHLETVDPVLLLFIKFISYNFLRPVEVCRIKIKDIDLANKTIQFKAKNSPLKTKIIPEILLSELPDLSQMDGEHYLFTPECIGGEWDTLENNRRDYFSKRFLKLVKTPFNLGKDYTLYSFRHTFITKLYRAISKDSSPFAAKSALMQITGHASMDALQKYLRDIDAELPEDYSAMLK
ncbi:tyrosine-type recombinase/integrase [Mariniflexile sp. AS56]|uniref:tyrosine-type recombinase/integrase n=1 Tax=Mariniflexile sp. AS56 TaxID=3063957 RepID=UPI0026F1EDFE|nr:site-specific integrase [Mariniflexile sp. AS56]MDO7173730.1 site-specific integrase [Mariniflexile sp. AS56]